MWWEVSSAREAVTRGVKEYKNSLEGTKRGDGSGRPKREAGTGGGGHRGSVGTGRGRKARRKAEGWHNWGLPPEPAQPSNLSMFDPILSLCTSIVRFHLSFFYWRTMEDCHQQCVLQTNQIVVIFAVVGTALKCSLGDLSQSIETCFLLLFGPPHPPKS